MTDPDIEPPGYLSEHEADDEPTPDDDPALEAARRFPIGPPQ